jgi:hypothetical protein
MSIVDLAFRMLARVLKYSQQVQRFFYEVMLAGHTCPECGGGLLMTGEAECRCRICRHRFDPTVAFQCCSECGGKVELRVRRYRCSRCGADVPSLFLFEGLAFDAAYFREKMAEHRRRRHEQRERVRRMLAECRSPAAGATPIQLDSVPGLAEALDSLAAGQWAIPELPLPQGFDLQRYQSHLQAHIGPKAVDFDELPPLEEDGHLDRIWRFIAVIFMAHAGLIDLWQHGAGILMRKHESDREGCGVPGETEEPA